MNSNLAERAGRVLIAGVSWVVLCYLARPLLVVIAISFTTTSYLSFPPVGATLRWYANVLSDPTFIEAWRYYAPGETESAGGLADTLPLLIWLSAQETPAAKRSASLRRAAGASRNAKMPVRAKPLS